MKTYTRLSAVTWQMLSFKDRDKLYRPDSRPRSFPCLLLATQDRIAVGTRFSFGDENGRNFRLKLASTSGTRVVLTIAFRKLKRLSCEKGFDGSFWSKQVGSIYPASFHHNPLQRTAH
jgi:hypothetical protein